MIGIRGIGKQLGNFSLTDISIEIPKGEYVVLLGDSGSGKSVLLEIIAGLMRPDKGAVYFNDIDLSGVPVNRQPFGLVFQDLALFPHLTVYQNVAYSLRVRNADKYTIEKRVSELSAKLEISGLADRYPSNLSGGERQRVALARTLATEPECLLLDEPLAAVDARIRKEIRSVLRNLHRDGQTIIHVTHDYLEAMNLASRIGIMENGRLIQYGPALEVLKNPASPFMASFTGVRNFLPVTLRSDPANGTIKAWTENGIPIAFNTDKNHGNGYLMIPEDAIILSTEPVKTSAANQFPGTITDFIPTPYGFEVAIDVGFILYALLTSEGIERLGLKAGDPVFASFKATSVRFIRK